MKSNPLDQQAARAAAKRLFQKANFSGGPLQSYEISSLLSSTYEYLKLPFNPTSRDIKSYSEVLDANKDGQVTLADLQTLALQYLCGPGVLKSQSFDSSAKRHKYQVSAISTDSYSNSFSSSYATPQLQSSYETAKQPFLLNGNHSPGINFGQSTHHQQCGKQTLKILSLTKAIFQRNADENYTITIESVVSLLAQTYETLGRKNQRPSTEDARVWLRLCDGNGDGHVEYQQYEYFVVRSLESSGHPIYQ